jgi:two-component system sensor histidine kinase PhcS
MSDFQKAYAEQNRRDYIAHATLGQVLSLTLNLACALMDHVMYPDKARVMLMVRLATMGVVALVWLWFLSPLGRKHHRIFGVVWFASPLVMILWLIYYANDPVSPYYAGLNIVLVAVGLILPWNYIQNLITAILILLGYVLVCRWMPNPQPLTYTINNATFLCLTAVLVVSGSVASAKQRLREFRLRWDLDISRNQVQENNITLDRQNKELEETIQKLTEAESQLVQSEKMASLGRMSAGIIHEINNPLNFATTGLFTLRKKAKHIAPEQLEEYNEILKDVEDGVARVKNIVSDLRMFTHPNSDNLDEVEAAEVVASALRFLSNEMKDKASIEIKLTERQTVHANKNKLIHVFVNLIQNSLDAMKEKPFPDGERPTIWIESLETKDANCLIVRDNGPGITSEHIDKIFDPFYTTKDVGEGMGLGLSICYRIMQECQGKISVRTEPGKFCEFTLEFPKPV